MPQLYPVTLYYNTHFNRGNIPDSPELLESFNSETFAPVYLRQDYGIAHVRLNATWAQVRDADYCRLGGPDGPNTYWVIPEPPFMATDNTAEIDLVLDPLTTVGGISAITVAGGWSERAHVTDDTLFSNILAEPWSPSQPMEIREYKVFHTDSGEGNIEIAIATCDLSRGTAYRAKIWHASQSVDGETVTGDVITPDTPIPGYGGTQPVRQDGFTTTLEINVTRDGETETNSYTLPGLYAFDLSNDAVTQGINAIRAIGIDSSIIAMYVIPKQDVTATPAPTVIYPGGEEKTEGMIAKLSGSAAQYATGMPYKYTNVRNNKTIALFNSYTITSITSGDSNTFAAHDLYAGGTAPDIVVQTDPSPSGTVYCSPTYFEGKKTHRLEQAVAGLPWLNAGFTYHTSSGGDLGMMNARRRNQSVDFNRDVAQAKNTIGQVMNVADTVGSIAGRMSSIAMAKPTALPGAIAAGASGTFSDVLGGVARGANLALERNQTDYNANYQMGDNLFQASVAANVTPPEMAFPISVNAAAYYGNGFAVVHNTLRDNDVQRLDDFFSCYGYARDTKFIQSMLSNRANHNYIKTTGAHIIAEDAPRWLTESIGRMFDAGVQIWHVVPSQSSLTDNPIRS